MSFNTLTYVMAKKYADQAITNAQMGGIQAGGEWSEETFYPKNTIVTKDGKIYIAIQDVPEGTKLSNDEFWTVFLTNTGSDKHYRFQ